jgi:hypothetical protein
VKGSGREFAGAVAAAIPHVKRGSLVVFGDIFGGRIDNIHTVVGAVANTDGSVTLSFDQGETLQIWGAEGVTVSATLLRVDRASRVRWEWFYYGREPTPQNGYFNEHLVVGDHVEATSNVDWYAPTFAPSLGSPAVELVGF